MEEEIFKIPEDILKNGLDAIIVRAVIKADPDFALAELNRAIHKGAEFGYDMHRYNLIYLDMRRQWEVYGKW